MPTIFPTPPTLRMPDIAIAVYGQVTISDKRLKRPSLPDIKGTADDMMDEEEFK